MTSCPRSTVSGLRKRAAAASGSRSSPRPFRCAPIRPPLPSSSRYRIATPLPRTALSPSAFTRVQRRRQLVQPSAFHQLELDILRRAERCRALDIGEVIDAFIEHHRHRRRPGHRHRRVPVILIASLFEESDIFRGEPRGEGAAILAGKTLIGVDGQQDPVPATRLWMNRKRARSASRSNPTLTFNVV